MPIELIRKSDVAGSARHVRNDVYETFRFLLKADGLGLTITDIILAPGIEADYGYDQHIEIAYCIEGDARLLDHETGETTRITPGTLWVAREGQRFRFVASAPTRLICVFTPAFEGGETGFAGDQ